jgi:hypothetical protein
MRCNVTLPDCCIYLAEEYQCTQGTSPALQNKPSMHEFRISCFLSHQALPRCDGQKGLDYGPVPLGVSDVRCKHCMSLLCDSLGSNMQCLSDYSTIEVLTLFGVVHFFDVFS